MRPLLILIALGPTIPLAAQVVPTDVPHFFLGPSDPGRCREGDFYYNSAQHVYKYCGAASQISNIGSNSGSTIPITSSALKGDGLGNAAAVTGAGSDCVHVDGTSAGCPGGGASIPNTTNILGGDNAGNAVASNIAVNADGSDNVGKAITWAAAYAPTYNSGGTTTCDFSQSNVCVVVMASGNTTLANSNPHGSGPYKIIWIQDTTCRTVTFPGSVSGGVQPDCGSGAVSIQDFVYYSSTYYGTSSAVPNSAWHGFSCPEASAPTGVVGYDIFYCDSSAHRFKGIDNNGSSFQYVHSGGDVNTSDQVTVTHLAAPQPISQGGTNGTDAADNGGIVYSNASQYKILAHVTTAGLALLSGNAAAPTWSVGPPAQKFFGTATPGSVPGNLPGDFYSDTTNHHDYWCNATAGTSAPACTSVTTGGWTLLDGNGSGTNYQTLNTAGPAGAQPAATGATQRTAATFAYPLKIDNSNPNIVSVVGACDPRSYLCFADEFMGGLFTASTFISSLNWVGNGNIGEAPRIDGSPASGTYGDVKIFSSDTTNTNTCMYVLEASNAGWNINMGGTTFDVLIRGYISSTTGISAFFGFMADPGSKGCGEAGSENTLGIGYDTNQGDTNWMCIARGASTSTRTSIGVAANTSPHTFRIRSTTGGTILCSVDGGSETTVSTNVPTAAEMEPFFSIYNRASAATQLDADFIQGWIAVSR